MSVSLVSFSKYSGCGNDFILVDNRKHCWNLGLFPNFDRSEIARLCHRRHGIGADGVIFLESSLSDPYCMRIFNADGYETEMCGNGVRCLVGFLRDSGAPDSNFTIRTMEHRIQTSIEQSYENKHIVRVSMPAPVDCCYNVKIDINNAFYEIHSLNTGVPHAILFVENLECPTLMQLAPTIRFHSHFPKGTNVNFITLSGEGIHIRTYERGVEEETLACGTGAVAAAIVASQLHGLSSPVNVHTRSTEVLQIDTTSLQHLTMTGPATHLYDGSIRLKPV